MTSQEFSPRESLERILARWWVIVLITVLGGIVGWTFHFLKPPVYEARAVITINMDFTKRELTQYEEDYAFNAAGAIIASTPVKDQIVSEARAQGILIDTSQLQRAMYSEGKQSVWELRVRDRDPKVAAGLANIWAEKATEALDVALGHALRADQIQDQIDSITNSQPNAAGSPGLSAETQVALQNLSDELLQEKQKSRGMISIMIFAFDGSALVLENPILYDLANLVLAGACIGFVISLWVVNSYKVQRCD
jgi:capsular polysaccharide biosynthesis protein